MTFLQWRRFNFFDKELVKVSDTEQQFDQLKDYDISCCSSGRGQIIIGDFSGSIHFVDRQFHVHTLKAFELRTTHLYQLKQHNILVSIGEDEVGINPLVKVWNMDKMDRAGNPMCTRIVRAIPGNKPTPVSCLAVHENLNFMVVGFADGSVVLFKGDVTRERHSKHRILHQSPHPVTGMAFRQLGKNIILYIATMDTVLSFNVSVKDKETKQLLDNHGCNLKCSVLSDGSQEYQFIIGRPDAVYFYQPEGRGACLAFEGEKLQMCWYRSYLVVVSKEAKAVPKAPVDGQPREMNILTIYDIKNKFIAYSAPLPAVTDVVCEWGSLYVLAGEQKLYHLQEKDTQTKLDMLFKKNLYVLAISLAKSQQYDEQGLVDIFRQYGDHLYSKGDHEEAIVQYIKTIGVLEPSYVIRKFLDAQRIHNLTRYLQALHTQGLATEDHTTLLLNCYTKLKDKHKLDKFIMTKSKEEVDFDVITAIKVCRQAGYHDHALYLAEKFDQHDWYLKVQLEDIRDYAKALKYIANLDFYEAEAIMKAHGKMLVNEAPDQTTELLKTLCTDYRPVNMPLVDDNTLDGSAPRSVLQAKPDEFIHIFVNNSAKLREFLEHMIKVQPGSSSLVYNTLIELYLHDVVHEASASQRKVKEEKILGMLQNPAAGYDIDQALVLCQMHNFRLGVLYLYEKSKLYQQILSHHMEHKEYTNIVDTCKKFGTEEPNLWVQALWYFAKTEDCYKTYLTEVLTQIDKKNLLPPLMVVETLGQNSTATLAVIKDYIMKRLKLENDEIAENERLIKQFKEETVKMRGQIEELKTSAQIFQVSKCSACNHPLELPSVHFLCQHSYHQHCFESYADNEQECPACLPQNKRVLDRIKEQEQSRNLHDQFHSQLQNAQDGFAVVADYFRRGVFNNATLVPDPQHQTKPPSGLSRARDTLDRK